MVTQPALRIIYPVLMTRNFSRLEEQLASVFASTVERNGATYQVSKITICRATDKISDFRSIHITTPQLSDEQKQSILDMEPLSHFLQVEGVLQGETYDD